jgi:hypothetical protein
MTFGKRLLLRLYTIQNFVYCYTRTYPPPQKILRRNDSPQMQIRNNKKRHIAPSTQQICIPERFLHSAQHHGPKAKGQIVYLLRCLDSQI